MPGLRLISGKKISKSILRVGVTTHHLTMVMSQLRLRENQRRMMLLRRLQQRKSLRLTPSRLPPIRRKAALMKVSLKPRILQLTTLQQPMMLPTHQTVKARKMLLVRVRRRTIVLRPYLSTSSLNLKFCRCRQTTGLTPRRCENISHQQARQSLRA